MRLRRDPRWREIRRRVPAGGRIVDMGSGLGQWVAFLAGSGYAAAGVDYSAPLIATARERHRELEWIQGPMEKVPLPDASVDAVISWGVIEHRRGGPQRALAEFRRLIRPGGHVFVTVPIDTERMRRASVGERRRRPLLPVLLRPRRTRRRAGARRLRDRRRPGHEPPRRGDRAAALRGGRAPLARAARRPQPGRPALCRPAARRRLHADGGRAVARLSSPLRRAAGGGAPHGAVGPETSRRRLGRAAAA